MKTTFLRSITAVTALASGALLTAAAQAETLADVVAYAYETDPGLQAQRASLRALDENYVQARGGYGTNVAAQLGGSIDHDRFSGASHDATTNNETLSIVQPLSLIHI